MATPDSAPHEYIDAEFSIGGLASPMDEQKLLETFDAREGIRSIALAGHKLIVEYEPVLIHKTQIEAAIEAAGFRVGDVESVPASPIVEAIFEHAASHLGTPAQRLPPPQEP